jgi:hypothetical protein
MANNHLQLSFVTPEKDQKVVCKKVLRYLPEKRLVCVADFITNKTHTNGTHRLVVAKLFIHKKKDRHHWRCESEGLNILSHNDILTPTVLYDGRLVCQTPDPSFPELSPGAAIYSILLTLIPNAISLRDLWHGSEDLLTRVAWLRKTLLNIAEQHNKGIIQKDLHLGNFLISENQIFSVDGDSIRKHKRPLSHRESWKWVGIFFAQIFPKYDYLLEEFLSDYCNKRQIAKKQGDLESIAWHRYIQRQRIKKSCLKKIYRNSGACRFKAYPHRLLLCNRLIYSPSFWEFLINFDTSHRYKQLEGRIKDVKFEGEIYQAHIFFRREKSIRRWMPENAASTHWQRAHMRVLFGEETEQPAALILHKICGVVWKGYYIAKQVRDFHLRFE